jgi:hypothetical protein
MRLSALTDVNFATWDYAHQILRPVIAVAGSLSLLRGGESNWRRHGRQQRLELAQQ